jgi:hypothetical protein
MGRTEALAGTTLAVLALLAGPSPAGAQCDPKNEQEVFSMTIDAEEEIYQLEKIKRQIEVEHDIMTIYPGGAGLITSEQAGEMFGAAVFQGVLDPDSIPERIRTMRVMTNIYLKDYIEPDLADARACLAKIKLGPQAPPPPGPPSAAASQIDWPVPMDWLGVKGSVGGSYVAECSGYRDYPAFRSAGTWRLEFLGDGQVRGVFGDEARQYSGLGAIKSDGSASGLARSSNEEVPHLSWSAQFQRSGVDLVISSHKLDLMAASRGTYAILVECKPGDMRQE